MYSTSSTMLIHRRQSLTRRNTQPEVFTFDHIPAAAASYPAPTRPKKRCTRVMYPAKVRMHLPPPEKSAAKRWLLLLVLVLLWQIYTEEPCADSPTGSGHSSDDYQAFPAGGDVAPADAPSSVCDANAAAEDGTTAGPTGNGYMVALLVYHRLGGEN
ncbi:radiation-inducible immediate-early gene IEX-1 [Syngnathoides biaculeatus]|uniref:radiation-inducible immediate-early gene IEX-1 n=1 Tax=Syngnathoides biaculeatus TaxID=300417 RepID=UPI002ADE4BCD|nr:radiation-inducible immediate-early gene IEX-1 [Syngnathoides biaculeatus]